ncbi:hypothetical protein [Salinilacihabitans rarus]|uniref:hypothetical protein n=1 Tax=Salinilacihabitans rarus TaxID=2961596 RepID=UPI0020C84A1E|nr:hypothetical protein [Salinilacihabitans rarus]
MTRVPGVNGRTNGRTGSQSQSRGPLAAAREVLDPRVGGARAALERPDRIDPPYERWLDDALAALFRPVEADGFWDDEAGRFVRALCWTPTADGLAWAPPRGRGFPHGPLATMGAMAWRDSPAGTDAYDAKLRRQLAACRRLVAEERYADRREAAVLGPLLDAFARAGTRFGDEWLDAARECFERTRGCAFERAADGLVLAGWATLAERTGDREVRAALSEALGLIDGARGADDPLGLAAPAGRRHRHEQYACWGLARAAAVTDRRDALDAVEAALERAIDRRLRGDGAFLATTAPLGRRLSDRALELVGAPPGRWRVLFAADQTAFATAVAEYAAAGGEYGYEREVAAAMGWLAATNPLGTDLRSVTGLGVPLRAVATDGRIDLPRHRFVGVHEVGTLVAALTHLTAGALADDRAVGDAYARAAGERDTAEWEVTDASD